MSYRLEFEIAGLPKILSNGSHSSWRAVHAEKKKWKQEVRAAVMWEMQQKKIDSSRLPLSKAKLTLTRHSSKEGDFDGLVSSFKAVIDGLTECGVIQDDRMSVIGQPSYAWEKSKPKQGRISVKVEEV